MIQGVNSYVVDNIDVILHILLDNGFIEHCDDKYQLTIKGKSASSVNECNIDKSTMLKNIFMMYVVWKCLKKVLMIIWPLLPLNNVCDVVTELVDHLR